MGSSESPAASHSSRMRYQQRLVLHLITTHCACVQSLARHTMLQQGMSQNSAPVHATCVDVAAASMSAACCSTRCGFTCRADAHLLALFQIIVVAGCAFVLDA